MILMHIALLQVSSGVAKFSDAEIACMPFPVNSLYDSRLMWTSDRMIFDHVARLVRAEHGTPGTLFGAVVRFMTLT